MTFTGRVLALDLATTTGWAYGCPGSNPQCGHIRFTKPGSSRAQTYRAFRNWLDEAWGQREEIPDLIAYESPAVPSIMGGKTNIDTTRMLVGLAEHVEEWAYGKAELREATTSQVRCHFLGQNRLWMGLRDDRRIRRGGAVGLHLLLAQSSDGAPHNAALPDALTVRGGTDANADENKFNMSYGFQRITLDVGPSSSWATSPIFFVMTISA
jgi:hypothetical protein